MSILTKWGVNWERDIGKSGLDWRVERETADFLYGFTRMIKPLRVLEIGTFEGTSAIAIGQAMKDNARGKLWTIDMKDYGQKKNISDQGLSDIVECLMGKAETALKLLDSGSLDFVFIDDGHAYEDAIRDLIISEILIRKFGYILGHDIFEVPDVNKAVNNFLSNKTGQYEKIIIASYAGLFILRKL